MTEQEIEQLQTLLGKLSAQFAKQNILSLQIWRGSEIGYIVNVEIVNFDVARHATIAYAFEDTTLQGAYHDAVTYFEEVQ